MFDQFNPAKFTMAGNNYRRGREFTDQFIDSFRIGNQVAICRISQIL